MSALGRFAASRRRSSRAVGLSEEEFAAALSGARSPTAPGAKRALGLAAWYSGVRYLAESLAYLPVSAWRGVGDNRSSRALPLWLVLPEADENGRPVMTRGRLFESWMMSVLHRGDAYGAKLRDSMDRVTGMRYLHPDRVKTTIVAGEKVHDVDVDGRGTRRRLTAREIFHFVGISEDGITGISPIAAHAKNLSIAVAADEFAGKYFEQGTMMSSYFQITEAARSRKDPEELKAELQETYQGLQNAHEAGVLSYGIEYKTVTLNAKDTQVLEARAWSVLEIARILRVPPHKIYDLSRATFANIEQQAIEAVGDGPRVWAERFEEQISADPDLITRDSSIEFNLEALTRGDSIAETNTTKAGIRDGYMTLAEARRRRGLPPAAGMDVVYRPANLHVVDAATGEVIIPAGAPVDDASDTDDDDAPIEGTPPSDDQLAGRTNAELAELLPDD